MSNKALTTVKAMLALGNSVRGLQPKHKRLLYRTCVVPIMCYGVRLWYFNGARNKGAINESKKVQRRAALWITGAFKTTPTGAVESLAGLPLVHLHFRKLVDRANMRVRTLLGRHAVRSLVDASETWPSVKALTRKTGRTNVRSPVVERSHSLRQ